MLAAADAKAQSPIYAPFLDPGMLLRTSAIQAEIICDPAYVRNPVRLIFSDGWRATEPDGTWMNGSSAEIRFRTPFEEGREVSITLCVLTSPWVTSDNMLRVWATAGLATRKNDGARSVQRVLEPDRRFGTRVVGTVEENGHVVIRFRLNGSIIAPGENLPLAIRVAAVGYAVLDSPIQRVELAEQLALISFDG
jgi:hypothetical protein